MALNQKAIKVLGKVFEAGFTDEKSIAAMQWTIFLRYRVSP